MAAIVLYAKKDACRYPDVHVSILAIFGQFGKTPGSFGVSLISFTLSVRANNALFAIYLIYYFFPPLFFFFDHGVLGLIPLGYSDRN